MNAVLVPGDGVELRGLIARPELNGRLGRLLWSANDRWVVELEASAPDATDERIKIKPANLNKIQTSESWSLELNKQAVAAQKAGDHRAAERTWTKVLDVISTSERGDQIKVLHGNRASARLRLGDANGALEDAERCVSLDVTWEKGWMRRIDALEALGRIVQAYDVALDAWKCLGHDSRTQVKERRDRLAAHPETQGFLRDTCPFRGKTFCCACNALQKDRPDKSFLKCGTCSMVFYCDTTCQRNDASQHARSCRSLQAAHLFDGLHSAGRLWFGCVDDNGQPGEYGVLIDGRRRFEFPRFVCDLSSSAKGVRNFDDWATLITSNSHSWKMDPVSKVLTPQKFRSIMSGKDISPEDFIAHQLATQVASYPLTLYHALRKFELPGSKDVLVIHVIGAEASCEGAFLQELNSIIHSLLAGTMLLIMTIGPLNVASPTPESDAQTFRALLSRPDRGAARCFNFRGTYDEFLASKLYSPPDLVMAFNGGFHDGTYPWWPTLQFLLHEDVPLAVTCFSNEDLASTQKLITENSMFKPRTVLGETGTSNPFASRFLTPRVEGQNVMQAQNMHLLCMRGIERWFPKNSPVFDAAHTELMTLMVSGNLEKDPHMPEAEAYILKQRARSYIAFTAALEKVRPCRRQDASGLISTEHPGMWKSLVAKLEQ